MIKRIEQLRLTSLARDDTAKSMSVDTKHSSVRSSQSPSSGEEKPNLDNRWSLGGEEVRPRCEPLENLPGRVIPFTLLHQIMAGAIEDGKPLDTTKITGHSSALVHGYCTRVFRPTRLTRVATNR